SDASNHRVFPCKWHRRALTVELAWKIHCGANASEVAESTSPDTGGKTQQDRGAVISVAQASFVSQRTNHMLNAAWDIGACCSSCRLIDLSKVIGLLWFKGHHRPRAGSKRP